MTSALRWLHRLAMFTASSAVFLVFAGGMVTSTGSGLAVPDWPLSYGTLFPPMVGGIFYEHGHRVIAGAVALLTAGLALLAWRVEPRRSVRRLALFAVVTVVVQAVLGGLTVLYLLPIAISVTHAAVANLFFCSVAILALVTRASWRSTAGPAEHADTATLPRRWILLVAIIFLQILVGALMRHSGAGLAIPDFPLAFGRLFPPFTTWPVMVHYAHRLGALVVLATAAWAIGSTWRRARDVSALMRPAGLLATLLPIQILLGGITIWSEKNPLLTSLHVVVGTVILGTALWTAVESSRRSVTHASTTRAIKSRETQATRSLA